MTSPYPLIRSVRFWWSVIIIPVGLVGNILCLLVVSRKENRSISCSVYMGALTACDILVLLFKALQICLVFGTTPLQISTFNMICSVIAFVYVTSSQSGSMIILALLLERVIVVTKPLKAALILSPKRALIITLVIPFLSSIFNIPHLFSYASKVLLKRECVILDGSVITNSVYSMLTLFISGVLPLFGILIMNIIILCAIKSSKFSRVKRPKHHGSRYRRRPSSAFERTQSISLTSTSSGDATNGSSPKLVDSADGDLSKICVPPCTNPSCTSTRPIISSMPSQDIFCDKTSAANHLGMPARNCCFVDLPNSHRNPEDNNDLNISIIETHNCKDIKHSKMHTSAICVDEADLVASARTIETHLSTKQFNKKKRREQMMTARDRQLTIMTLVMTMAFLLFVCPFYLRVVLFLFLKQGYDDLSAARAWISTMT